MKPTGIIRRIDDLGRIVIPKEMRRTLRIHEGDPLEEFVVDGGIFLKKYSQMKSIADDAQKLADTLFETTGHKVLVTDNDTIIAVSGTSKKDFYNKPIWNLASKAIEERNTKTSSVEEEDFAYEDQIVVPVICEGEVIGAIGLIAKSQIGVLEQKLLESFSTFLSRQLEG
jgi:AbrB family transcriptional regulator (stage V sporulation protein T)